MTNPTTPPPCAPTQGGDSPVRTSFTHQHGLGVLHGFDDEGTEWPIDFCELDKDFSQVRMLREIDRRVNLFPELVEALQNYLKAHNRAANSRPAGDAFSPWSPECECSLCVSARAALAKASRP